MIPDLDPRVEDFLRTSPLSWGTGEWEIEPVHSGGSGRQVLRLSQALPGQADRASWILLAWTDQRPDNDRFLPTQRILERRGVRVPGVIHASASLRLAIVEDLGRRDLWGERSQPWPRLQRWYREALASMAPLHQIRPEMLEANERAALMPGFDPAMYRWEQAYFFDQCVTRLAAADARQVDRWRSHPALEEMAAELGATCSGLVHRDCQSQNLMLQGEQVVMVDFQGLRAGRAEYDIASLLCDPYVALGRVERATLFEDSARMRGLDPQDRELRRLYSRCAVQRLMQALGAYGNLGLNLGKTGFLKFIPPAARLLSETITELPELGWMQELLEQLPDGDELERRVGSMAEVAD